MVVVFCGGVDSWEAVGLFVCNVNVHLCCNGDCDLLVDVAVVQRRSSSCWIC